MECKNEHGGNINRKLVTDSLKEIGTIARIYGDNLCFLSTAAIINRPENWLLNIMFVIIIFLNIKKLFNIKVKVKLGNMKLNIAVVDFQTHKSSL